MVLRLMQEARECYHQAERCRRQADATVEPDVRADYLDFEARWLFMAQIYEFSARVVDFTRRFNHDVLAENESKALAEHNALAPACPRCRSPMQPGAPQAGAASDFPTFRCDSCGYVETIDCPASTSDAQTAGRTT